MLGLCYDVIIMKTGLWEKQWGLERGTGMKVYSKDGKEIKMLGTWALPAEFVDLWEGLDHAGQRELLTNLGSNLKPLKYVIRCPLDPASLSRIALYCMRYKIKYTVKQTKKYVKFIFDDKGVRNDVLIGMNTI